MTPMPDSKVTKRIGYIAPTPAPRGAYAFQPSHSFTPPDSSALPKPVRPRSGLLKPATQAEKEEELVTLMYTAPPRARRPPIATPAATFPSTPPDDPVDGCQDVPDTPAGQTALLKDLLQEQGTTEPIEDTIRATPAALEQLLCTVTTEHTTASDGAYDKLLCPTLGRSSVLKLSIDSFAVGPSAVEEQMSLRRSVASETETVVHTGAAAPCVDHHPVRHQLSTQSDAGDAHVHQSEMHTAPEGLKSNLPSRTVTPKPSDVLASTPDNMECSAGSETDPAPQDLQAVEPELVPQSPGEPDISREQVTPSQSHSTTPGSWLLPGSSGSVKVHESMEAMVLPELSNEQWEKQVPDIHASSPLAVSSIRHSAAVPGAREVAAEGRTQPPSLQDGDVANTPPPCSLREERTGVLQVHSAQQVPDGSRLPRMEGSAPGRLAMPALPADTGSDLVYPVALPPSQGLAEENAAESPGDRLSQRDDPGHCAQAPFWAHDHLFSKKGDVEDVSRGLSERDGTEHELLRRSITDVVTFSEATEVADHPCLRNSISDVAPIDLNPQTSELHCLAPEMPIFTSPVPQNPSVHERQAKAHPAGQPARSRRPAPSGIPGRVSAASSAPDSPCSRSLSKSAKTGGASSIPALPGQIHVHPLAMHGSPSCPPAPRPTPPNGASDRRQGPARCRRCQQAGRSAGDWPRTGKRFARRREARTKSRRIGPRPRSDGRCGPCATAVPVRPA